MICIKERRGYFLLNPRFERPERGDFGVREGAAYQPRHEPELRVIEARRQYPMMNDSKAARRLGFGEFHLEVDVSIIDRAVMLQRDDTLQLHLHAVRVKAEPMLPDEMMDRKMRHSVRHTRTSVLENFLPEKFQNRDFRSLNLKRRKR